MIVSRDGWVKRQKEVKDLSTTRLREGDQVLAALPGSTRATVVFFSNFGVAYTARIIDVPASTGYGEPIQRLFKLKDGETSRRGAAASIRASPATCTPKKEGDVPPVHAVAVTSDGYSLRFSLEPFVEPSTRAGRRYARTAEGAEVVGVARVTGGEILIAATREARAMLCKADEVNFLSGPGRGVILIKLDVEGGSRPRLHRVVRRSRSDDRRNRAAARSRRSARRSTKSPAAAARAASCCSAASSRRSSGRPRRRRRRCRSSLSAEGHRGCLCRLLGSPSISGRYTICCTTMIGTTLGSLPDRGAGWCRRGRGRLPRTGRTPGAGRRHQGAVSSPGADQGGAT